MTSATDVRRASNVGTAGSSLSSNLGRTPRWPAAGEQTGGECSRETIRDEQYVVLPPLTSVLLARRKRPRRPVRLRAVAQGPQVVPHPDGGHDVRRRAAQPRDEARGVGLAELGGRRDRRGALRQARARPRAQGRADRAVVVLQEVAADPDSRTTRARADRGVHQGSQGHRAHAARQGRADACSARRAPRRQGRGRRRTATRNGARALARAASPAASPRSARSGAGAPREGAPRAARPATLRRPMPCRALRHLRGRRGLRQVHADRSASPRGCARAGSIRCVTREPGGTPLAEAVRALLLDPARRPGARRVGEDVDRRHRRARPSRSALERPVRELPHTTHLRRALHEERHRLVGGSGSGSGSRSSVIPCSLSFGFAARGSSRRRAARPARRRRAGAGRRARGTAKSRAHPPPPENGRPSPVRSRD